MADGDPAAAFGDGALGDPLLDFDGEGAEGGDQAPEDEKQLKDAVLFVIDCASPDALAPLGPGGRSVVGEALAAAATMLKTKVVTSPEDKVGVVLYGVREHNNPNGFEGISLIQELDRPKAQHIKQLEAEMARSPASFDERYGAHRPVPLSDVFWTCTTLFNLSANPKQFEPRVWLFTGNDAPCRTLAEEDAAVTRARDLCELGVEVVFFPLPVAGHSFSMDKFWSRVVPVDVDDYVARAAFNLDNLERWIRMRVHRKRVLQRIPFELCPGAEVAVHIYCTTIQARAPLPVYLKNENNKPLKSEAKLLCQSTGSILNPAEDVDTYFELAGERVYMTRAEVGETKRYGDPGLQLLGFKAVNRLQPHHRIFHSYFVYPNERAVKGSAVLCRALIDRMLARRRMAIARYIARRNSEPALVALLPQAEVVDDDGIQVHAPGFHMIRLPWGEEIRQIDIPAPAGASLTPESASAAGRVVQAMRLNEFRPGCVENPVLQKHYAAVQALALGEDQVAETADLLQQDTRALEAKAPLLQAWRAAIDGATPPKAPPAAPGKRPLPVDEDAEEEAPRPRARREAPLAAPATFDEMRALVASGEVDRLTVGALRDWLKSQGISVSGKKGDLVNRARAVV